MNKIKIKELFNIEKGTLQSLKNIPGEFDFITASEDWKTHNSYSHDCEALIFAMGASGSLGRTHYVNGKFISSDLCFILTSSERYQQRLDLEYYYYIFNFLRNNIIKKTATGTSKLAINITNFENYELPYCEIDNQIKFKNILKSLEIEKLKLDIEHKNQEKYLSQLRQVILQFAFQGKLTPQLPTDENVNELLMLIEKHKVFENEKNKKIKTNHKIDLPIGIFDVPVSWGWSRLELICDQIGDIDHKMPKAVEIGIPFISAKDLKDNGTLDFSDPKFISEEDYERLSRKIKPTRGDIIYSRIGAQLGKARLVEVDEKFLISYSCCLIRPLHQYVYKKYLQLFLDSHLALNQAHLGTQSIGVPDLGMGVIKKYKIPIPPREEQRRIVARVDQLMSLCDKLEAGITRSQADSEKLMEAVVGKMLAG